MEMEGIALACSLIESLQRELERQPGYRAVRIGLLVSERAKVDRETLRSSFEALLKSAALEGLRIEIQDSDAPGEQIVVGYLELEECEKDAEALTPSVGGRLLVFEKPAAPAGEKRTKR